MRIPCNPEAPRELSVSGDADAGPGDDLRGKEGLSVRSGSEGERAFWVVEVPSVILRSDTEGLGELGGSGTKVAVPKRAALLAAEPHFIQTLEGFEGANQDKATFSVGGDGEKVQQPVNAIVEIDVHRSGVMVADEVAGGFPEKGMTSLIPMFPVGFRFHHHSGAGATGKSPAQ